jgi:hypothetical protein
MTLRGNWAASLLARARAKDDYAFARLHGLVHQSQEPIKHERLVELERGGVSVARTLEAVARAAS